MHSNLVFDPGFTTNFDYPSKTPMFSTIVQKPVSGRGEIRASLQPYPLWKIEYICNFARGSEQDDNTVYQYMLGFFMQMGGQFSDFLYLDPNDNQVTNMLFAVSDGATQQFQLTRSIGIGTDIVQNPSTDVLPVIYINGEENDGWTMGPNGLINFFGFPPENGILTWTGSFYYRVRFGDDDTTFDQMFDQIWNNGKVTLQSVIL